MVLTVSLTLMIKSLNSIGFNDTTVDTPVTVGGALEPLYYFEFLLEKSLYFVTSTKNHSLQT